MQDDPCTFSWQEKLANGRAAIGAASGLSDVSALWNVSLRAAVCSPAEADKTPLLKPMRGGARVRRRIRRPRRWRPCATLTIALLRLVPRRAPPKPYQDAGSARRT